MCNIFIESVWSAASRPSSKWPVSQGWDPTRSTLQLCGVTNVSPHPCDPFVFIFLMAYSMHNDLSRRILRLLLRIGLNNTTEHRLRDTVFHSLKIRDESVASGQRSALTSLWSSDTFYKHTRGQLGASNQARVHGLGLPQPQREHANSA